MIKHLQQSSKIDDSDQGSMEIVEATGLDQLQRAEIDVQVSTAKRWPRQIDQFKKRAIALATLDDETAESCLYRRPVGKEDGKEKFAEGMSIRMAEIVGASYGNLRVAATIIEQTERKVVARGMAFDLEANFASSSEVVESTVTKHGAPFSERMRTVVAKAALAKARRDATFQVVPRAIAKPVEDAVRQLLMGNSESLEKRRTRVMSWISKLGIGVERVFYALGIKGTSDLTAEELEKLTGLKTAIKDGEVSIDEAFPEIPVKMKMAAGVKEILEASEPTGREIPEATSKSSLPHNPMSEASKTIAGDVSKSSEEPAKPKTDAPAKPLAGDVSKPAVQTRIDGASGSEPTAADAPATSTVHTQFTALCQKEGISFDDFRDWAIKEQYPIRDIDSMGSFDELPQRLVRLWMKDWEFTLDSIKRHEH